MRQTRLDYPGRLGLQTLEAVVSPTEMRGLADLSPVMSTQLSHLRRSFAYLDCMGNLFVIAWFAILGANGQGEVSSSLKSPSSKTSGALSSRHWMSLISRPTSGALPVNKLHARISEASSNSFSWSLLTHCS
jgi:hypothetical protein